MRKKQTFKEGKHAVEGGVAYFYNNAVGEVHGGDAWFCDKSVGTVNGGNAWFYDNSVGEVHGGWVLFLDNTVGVVYGGEAHIYSPNCKVILAEGSTGKIIKHF